jgi:hypothetical protein
MIDDALFFDNDCFSSFIETEEEQILQDLFPAKIILPFEVFHELSHPSTPKNIRTRVIGLYDKKMIAVPLQCDNTSEFDYELYALLLEPEVSSLPRCGKGEAAAIVYAKMYKGIIASNNLRDVLPYVRLYSLRQKTTGSILSEAVQRGMITPGKAESIWSSLLLLGYLMPTPNFNDYWSQYFLKGRI